MSYKFIQLIKTNNKHKNLFKVEIADKDQSLYIRFLSQNPDVKYGILEVDIPANKDKIYSLETKNPPDIEQMEIGNTFKFSHHYSGEVHLQKYHNNKKNRIKISQEFVGINMSKLDNKLNHIATICINNLDFFPESQTQIQDKIEYFDLSQNNIDLDKFVIIIFSSKRDFFIDKEGKDILNQISKNNGYVGFSIFQDDQLQDKSSLIYYYFAIREKLTEKITSDLCLYLGWDENIRNTSIDNKMLFVQTI